MLTGTNLKIRTFQWNDLPEVVDLINASLEALGEDYRDNVEETEHEWRSPEYFPERDYFVIRSNNNKLIGFAQAEPTPQLPNRGFGWCVVHPDHRNQGIGTALVKMSEEHFLKTVTDITPADQPIYMNRWASMLQTDALELLKNEGYSHIRTFYTMRIALDEPVEKPEMPEGIEIRPFDPERDAHAVHEAHQESFRDHWGHLIDTPYEEWAHRLTSPDFNANLYFIAYEGDQVAGISLCRAWGPDIPDMAWVGTLGVRRQWRKRGLGMALLRHSFHVFQQQGFKKAGLGVDGSSKTNAVALYERAGMYVHRQNLMFRKMFRGNQEDVQD